MNGLFVIFEALAEHSGISKKIKAQVEGFRNNGINMKLSSLVMDKTRANIFYGRTVDDQIIEKYSDNILINRLQRITRFENLFEYIQKNQISFIYIRYVHTANPYFINFLKKLKKNNIQVLLEVPTYPYDQEYVNTSKKQKLLIVIEKIYRKKFKYYIKNIITFSNSPTIFDVPTIRISNGIDINAIKLVSTENSNDIIKLIGVASISFWHGFDRLLEGLNYYYSSEQNHLVYFNIVGDINTSEAIKYQDLVSKYKLQDYVIFHDKQFGEKLDNIFDNSNMGIGCLGVHRKGITYIKSIKNREYCARGIPFIYAETDDDFDDKPFVLKAPADESPIDITRIVEFLETNEFDKNEIRAYATNNLTWDYQIQKIITQANIIQSESFR